LKDVSNRAEEKTTELKQDIKNVKKDVKY